MESAGPSIGLKLPCHSECSLMVSADLHNILKTKAQRHEVAQTITFSICAQHSGTSSHAQVLLEGHEARKTGAQSTSLLALLTLPVWVLINQLPHIWSGQTEAEHAFCASIARSRQSSVSRSAPEFPWPWDFCPDFCLPSMPLPRTSSRVSLMTTVYWYLSQGHTRGTGLRQDAQTNLPAGANGRTVYKGQHFLTSNSQQ